MKITIEMILEVDGEIPEDKIEVSVQSLIDTMHHGIDFNEFYIQVNSIKILKIQKDGER